MKPHHSQHRTTHQNPRIPLKTTFISGRAPYFSRFTRHAATHWLCVALSCALLVPCAANDSKEPDKASTQEEESRAEDGKKEPSSKNKKKSKTQELHIASSQEAIRAVQELPLPQTLPQSATSKPAATPNAPAKKLVLEADLPYVTSDEEPIVAPKRNPPPRTQTFKAPSSFKAPILPETQMDEEETISGGVLAPARVKGLPTFPSPLQKPASKTLAPPMILPDEEPDSQPITEEPAHPVFDGNDAAQMRVGGAMARGEILHAGTSAKLEISARNTGTSHWDSEDQSPVRVVIRCFDQSTKRRARWEIKWLRDHVAPGETLSLQPQFSVPRAGKFTVVVSLLRLGNSRFRPPSDDRAELKLPGEFARAVFQSEVRAAPQELEELAETTSSTRSTAKDNN